MALQLSLESYTVFSAATLIDDKLVQPRNANGSILVTPEGMMIEVSSEKLLNALLPILVTVLGIIVLLQPRISVFVAVSMMALQLSRESYLVFSTETLIEDNPVQPLKALAFMAVTLEGMFTEVRPMQPWNALSPILVTPEGMSIEVRPKQPLNILLPMLVNPVGIVVRPVQPWNALYPMLVTLEGMVTEVRPMQSWNA